MEQLDLFGAAEQPKIPATFAARPTSRIADLPPAPPPVTIKPVVSEPRRPEPKPTEETSRKAKPRRYVPTERNDHAAAVALAEAVSAAWHGAHGGEDIKIPIGTVAAIALWPLKGPDAPLLADWWLALGDADLITAFSECWSYWWITRPDLIDRAMPLHAWLQDEHPPRRRAQAIRAVVEAAIKNGLLHLTGSENPYFNATSDILGTLITVMRSAGAANALAEYHTPPEVSEMMAHLLLDDMDVKPGMTFDEPTSGTGGMFRAAAQVLRHSNLDPADFVWSMTDIDPLAAAGAAVNAILWGLGPNVVVAGGDVLHQANPTGQALKERREAYERRDELRGQAAVLAAIRKAEALLETVEHAT
ncbi:N-6 DNA methylase [Streptomyces spiramyceticus]|uniref:N-6 DNA methylase n=1 Tax=Streptomyces spiramyceticus TaxID=299717 RepID=UPI00237BD01C|nr:N-6 DNA methylase [Streptomyces spiramyceticus]